jgi:FkbM family methyltransferase
MNKHFRPIAFVLTSTNHGSLLVNRNDYQLYENGGYGVGYQIFNKSSYDQAEINFAITLLNTRRENFGDGVIAIDCGANIGVHTVEWSKEMAAWGEVIAIEAQERIYYALAGNITLNNLFNAKAIYAAVGKQDGNISVPLPNYFVASSFGSLEIRKKNNTEFIGQHIDYTEEHCVNTKMICIDGLNLNRLDLIKIDIEGMEIEALIGAEKSIKKFKPQLIIEKIKSEQNQLIELLEKYEYKIFHSDINLIAINKSDPAIKNFPKTN